MKPLIFGAILLLVGTTAKAQTASPSQMQDSSQVRTDSSVLYLRSTILSTPDSAANPKIDLKMQPYQMPRSEYIIKEGKIMGGSTTILKGSKPKKD